MAFPEGGMKDWVRSATLELGIQYSETLKREDLPQVVWITIDIAFSAIWNPTSAYNLFKEKLWDRDPDFGVMQKYIDFTICSSTQTDEKYTVCLFKDALSYNTMEKIHVRKFIRCECSEYKRCQHNDKVCMHCGCVLIVLALHNRECERIAYQKRCDDRDI